MLVKKKLCPMVSGDGDFVSGDGDFGVNGDGDFDNIVNDNVVKISVPIDKISVTTDNH